MMQNLSRRSRCSWRFNDDSVKFAYVVRSYSAVCYDYIRKVLPLPSRTLLSRKFGPVQKTLERNLARPECLDEIILGYFDRFPLSSNKEWLQCSLSIDAFSINILQKQNKPVIEGQPVSAIDGEAEVQVMQCDGSEEEDAADEACTNMFLIVLNPFRWELPSVILSVFPWKNGHADPAIVTILLDIVQKLKSYNINVRVIASDGDSGYACLHKPLYKVWAAKRKRDFFRIFNLLSQTGNFSVTIVDRTFNIGAYPVADPLHALKTARSRLLWHVVYLTPTVSISTGELEWPHEKWFTDRTQLGKMNDFYAISMFSPETFIRCCQNRWFSMALYVWPWLALIMVIRLPFLSLDCRKSLLHSSFLMFQHFLNEMTDGAFKETDIQIRYRKGCLGVTFFETWYLTRVIHLILALYGELLEGGHHLRLAAFGSHVNENMIGRIRVSCHGNHKADVIMRAISKCEVRRLLQWELGIEHTVRGRDNTGGTKLNAKTPADMEGLDFASLTTAIIQKALKDGKPEDVYGECQMITSFLSKVVERGKEAYHVYPPNNAANSGIMARLIRFASNEHGPGDE